MSLADGSQPRVTPAVASRSIVGLEDRIIIVDKQVTTTIVRVAESQLLDVAGDPPLQVA